MAMAKQAVNSSDALTIGAHVRKLRKRQKMTLERLSELTGISVSSLSRIENTQLGMSLEKVELLARAFGASPEELVSRSLGDGVEPVATLPVAPQLIVDRARKRRERQDREISTKYLFEDSPRRALECMSCTIQAISIWDSEFLRHPGEKIIYVMAGDAIVYCQGKPPTILETSDALYMDAYVWHSFVAVNSRPVELLVTYFHGPESRQGLLETRSFTPESWAALQAD
ncbi:transcriptional regulator, HTH_3 family [hydrothermal vent metagenome]|uniref:Transcriptional regulator, HTH_3 family n=1 Tax=hydrothermal vent metagenome TaxID=652676 RepID=A0A170PPC5_9ZZZZ